MGIRAISNNDVVFIAWSAPERVPNCLGFSVRRTKAGSTTSTALPAWVGFQGGSNAGWHPRTTDVWPVQRFSWVDVTAKRGATYTYAVVAMCGTADHLTDGPSIGTSDPVTVTPDRGNGISAYFNRGILSTQSVAHQLQQGPNSGPSGSSLVEAIKTSGNPLRKRLAGQSLEAMSSLLERAAKEGGSCYAALYELNDPDLLQLLLGAPAGSLHLILSNTGTDDAENSDARQKLHAAGVDIHDRMLGGSHIGHNKFMVYADANGTAKAVLTGSTNWSYTGVCAQSNNVIILESPELASAYIGYWNTLKVAGNAQDATLRTADKQRHVIDLGQTEIDLWFSPNTKQQTKPAKNPALPVDLNEVYDAIAAAKHAVLFLVFQPGNPSVLDAIADAQNKNPNLFVRGAATDPNAVDQYNVDLYHRSGATLDVVAAAAIGDQFGYWEQELLKTPGGHAIIHDKIIVIDPFDDDCVVVTGSHNLGYTASYKNDENMLLCRNNRELAAAYAAHVIDVYDHYRWRYTLQQKRTTQDAWNGLLTVDTWQDKYFTVPEIERELAFWAP